MSKANDRQVGGTHYKTADGGEEHWDRVHRLGLDYFQGQITKYVERWKLKNGIEDLKKARHFLDKYIELMEAHPDEPASSVSGLDADALRDGKLKCDGAHPAPACADPKCWRDERSHNRLSGAACSCRDYGPADSMCPIHGAY